MTWHFHEGMSTRYLHGSTGPLPNCLVALLRRKRNVNCNAGGEVTKAQPLPRRKLPILEPSLHCVNDGRSQV